MQVTIDSPWIVRFGAWFLERVPPATVVVLGVYYATAAFYARFLTSNGPIEINPLRDLAGFAALYAFFFVIRIFDEHKDYEEDLHNHPDRVLQRGLVTLGHLKAVGIFAVGYQIAVTLWIDGDGSRATYAWAVAFVWLLLMGCEFFIGEWLGERIVLYGTSHMIIMPMILAWVIFLGVEGADVPLQAHLLGLIAFLSLGGAEISRKIRAPEEERETLTSYSKALGPRGAPLTVIGLMTLEAAVVIYILCSIGENNLMLGLALAGSLATLGACLPFLRFLRSPQPGMGKKMEAAQGGAMLLKWITVLVAVLAERGSLWV